MNIRAVSLLKSAKLAQAFSRSDFMNNLGQQSLNEIFVELTIIPKDNPDTEDVWEDYINELFGFEIKIFPNIPFPNNAIEMSIYIIYLSRHYDIIFLPLSLPNEMSLRIAEILHVHRLPITTVLLTGSHTATVSSTVPLFDYYVNTHYDRWHNFRTEILPSIVQKMPRKQWLEIPDVLIKIERLLKIETCFCSSHDWGHGDIVEYPRLSIEAYSKGLTLREVMTSAIKEYGPKHQHSKDRYFSNDEANKVVRNLSKDGLDPSVTEFNIFYQSVNTEIQHMSYNTVTGNSGTTVVGGNKIGNITNFQKSNFIIEHRNTILEDLEKLRTEMKKEALSPAQDISVGHIAQAQEAIKIKDDTSAAIHLKSAGNWALAIAEKFGIALVVEVLKTAIND